MMHCRESFQQKTNYAVRDYSRLGYPVVGGTAIAFGVYSASLPMQTTGNLYAGTDPVRISPPPKPSIIPDPDTKIKEKVKIKEDNKRIKTTLPQK